MNRTPRLATTGLLTMTLLTMTLLAMTLLPGAASAAPTAPPAAALSSRTVEYAQGDAPLEGLLILDPASAAKRPGVVLVPDWMGMSPRAAAYGEKLAGLGYVVLVADVYGKGVHPASGKEAGPLAGKFKGDRALLRARVNAALDLLRRQPQVDGSRLVAVGYCFGGMGALELARSGASLAGVVTFHGSLGSPAPADARQIKAKVLALHGADDPFVPEAEVKGFEDELRAGGVDWQLVKYSGAVHSFTNPDAGTDNSKGAAYNAAADRRSWEAMKAFFAEVLR